MIRFLTHSVGLLALLCFTAGSAIADATIDFNNLSNGNLVGQDGWLFDHNNPQVGDGTGVDTSKIVLSASTADLAVHSRGVIPTAENSFLQQFDANLNSGNFGTALFGLGDGAGNNSISFGLNVPGNGPQGGVSSFYLFDRSSQFSSFHYIGSAIPAATASHWYRLQFAMDFAANSGDGAGSLSYEDLTLGDTAFTPVSGMQNIDLGLTAGNDATLNPTTWTHDIIYVGGGGALDNLVVGSSAAATPEPGDCDLFMASALAGGFVLRRRKFRCKA
jgi:hypothetical protein